MSSILFRTMFVLSIITFISGMIFVGVDNGPSVPFQPSVPSFNNFFPQEIISDTLWPIANGTSHYSPAELSTGCNEEGLGRNWTCVWSDDGNESYMTIRADIGTNYNYTSFEVSPTARSMYVTNIVVNIVCRSIGSRTLDLEIFANNSVWYPNWFVTCPLGNFDERSVSLGGPWIPPDQPNVETGFQIGLYSNKFSTGSGFENEDWGPTDTIQVTYVRLSVYSSTPAPCSGNWFENTGCQIGRVIDTIAKIIFAIINVFIFFGGWVIFLGQWIANGISVIVWLYSIPNLPQVIQAFVDVVITLWLGILGVESLKILKPMGG